MDDLELELKLGFLEEAQQLLQDAERCFLQIESSPDDSEIINQLFRLAHNLKGSANAVGFAELGVFTHLVESLLLKIKSHEIKVNSPIVDLLLACKDQLQVMLDGLRADLHARFDCTDLNARLQVAIDGGLSLLSIEVANRALIEGNAPPNDTGKINEQSLSDDTFMTLEGMPSSDAFSEVSDDENKACGVDILVETSEWSQQAVEDEPGTIVAQSPIEDVKDSPNLEAPSKREHAIDPVTAEKAGDASRAAAPIDESIRVSLARVDQLINFVGEMVILQSVLFEQAYDGDIVPLRKTVHQLGKISKELQEASMSLRMVPLKQTFQKMQRIVRDTSKSLDKVVNLELQGEETEVEKTVLEMIGDPLVHLVRNAVDHGIDSADERASAGKPVAGSILLRAYHQSDYIVLEVVDDGKGIDADRLRQKAIEKNILKPGQVITDKQAINLIFHPGFSTKQAVTDISGRGVGLDVVKTNIERLQGSVEVSTELGKGSKFRIQLPLTLAIIDATTVKMNDQRYAIPMTHIHESVQIKASDIQSSVNVGEIVNLRGENLKVFRLNELLGFGDHNQEPPRILLVSRVDDRPFGLLVHDISSMQQIVVKKLGVELSGLVGISGSAILGDGKPALILDLPRLIERPPKKTNRNSSPSSRA